jgi:hypothetical protein
VAGQWFYPGTPVSSTNEIDCLDITEILMKVALNTIILYIVRHIELQRLKLLLEIIYTFCCKRNTKY